MSSLAQFKEINSKMGKFNSSKTRVKPVFDALFENQERSSEILKKLLLLPHNSISKIDQCGFTPGNIINTHWGQNEIKLNAPKSLLIWLVENAETPLDGMPKASLDTQEKRLGLVNKDKSTIEKAVKLIHQDPLATKKWFILEGKTQPDVYIETENAIIVIEGKRTETAPTTSTQWMEVRHQMIRHIDAVWDFKKNKQVFGFFIVEGQNDNSEVPKNWIEYSELTINNEVLNKSLPHRTQQQRKQISDCFLGVTTWLAICNEFDIQLHLLPDEV
jgi:hypothetical protein